MHHMASFVVSSAGVVISGNRNYFITMLMTEMQGGKGIEVKQATEDADVMIVPPAVSAAEHYASVTITGEDIDLLVLLSALGNARKNIYFQKTGKGRTPTLVYSSHSFKHDPKDILFLQAISGCDTISAPFGIGQKKVIQIYKANPELSANKANIPCLKIPRLILTK